MKTMKAILVMLALAAAFGASGVAQAQGQVCTPTNSGSTLCNALPSFGTTAASFLSASFTWLASIIATGVMLMIIFSGIQMMFAQGDEGTIKQAKTNLTYSVIGFVVIMCAYVIVSMVEYLVGVNSNAVNNSFFFNPLIETDFVSFLENQVLRTMTVIATIALALIVVNGFRYMISSSEDQTKKAKKAVTWSVVGLLVVLLSYTIVTVVLDTI
jgi:hypothetical protein